MNQTHVMACCSSMTTRVLKASISPMAQGGGWVTVAPRDTCQQGNDSESAAVAWQKDHKK